MLDDEHVDEEFDLERLTHRPPSADAVLLKCGHFTESGPAVSFSGGRRLYECSGGCGLQERKQTVA